MLKIKANPTFSAKVKVPVPGGGHETIECEFKHMTRAALEAFISGPEAKDRSDIDTVMPILAGWKEVDADFSRENVAAMLDQYHAAARAILSTYIEELAQARAGN